MPGRLRHHAAGLILLAGLALGSRAEAHGGIWRAYEILLEPGNPEHIVLRSDVWALIETHDGGASWHWVCGELYGGQSGTAGDKRSMVLLSGGKMLVASGFEGLRSRGPDVCDEWPAIGPFSSEEIIRDVSKQDEAGDRLVVLTVRSDGRGGVITRVYQSTDRAESFETLGVDLPSGFSGTSAVIAPSDPTRIYVAGGQVGSTTKRFARSTDAGASWEVFDFPGDAEDWTLRVSAVDRSNPNVVYVWMDLRENSGGDVQPDSLWISRDAGATFTRVFDAVGNLPGFTFSPDGSRLLIAGPEDGIWGGAVQDVIDRGAEAFARVNEARIWGLAWREEGLLAGANDFTPRGVTPFSLGLSRDEGATFEPLFEICSTELVSCPSESFGDEVCPGRFSDPNGEGNFKEDFLDSERCLGHASDTTPGPRSMDAGSDLALSYGGSRGNGETGCSCAVGRRATGSLAGAGLLASLMMLFVRRGSRRQVS